LTQADLAARAGTSRTRLSAYEHAHTDPGLETLERITKAAGLELAVVPAGTHRVGEQVARITATLTAGDERYALRLVAELADWVRTGTVSPAALDADPGSTGDQRWDAVIGGVAEMLARELAHAVPAWASAPSRFLNGWWFVTQLRSVRASVFVETPAALAARGVLLSASSLGST
jgi:transcriptional regulator with XRE-family HTH domain